RGRAANCCGAGCRRKRRSAPPPTSRRSLFAKGIGVHRGAAPPRAVPFGRQSPAWRVGGPGHGESLKRMGMRGRLRGRKGNRLDALLRTDRIGRKRRALPLPDGSAAAQVRQCESRNSVAAEIGAQQREERCVLRNRQKLPLAQSPADGCEVEWKKRNLPEKRIHAFASRSGAALSVL